MRRVREMLTLVAVALAGCQADRLDVALGGSTAEAESASRGLDAAPAEGGSGEGVAYGTAFQDFESVTVRLAGDVVLESGPASVSLAVAPDQRVYSVTVNADGAVTAAEKDALVRRVYSAFEARGWRYARGTSPDVAGKIPPERWRRCLDGHSDSALSEQLPAPGSGVIFGAHFERSSSGVTARAFVVFACRLEDDQPVIEHQLLVSLAEHD